MVSRQDELDVEVPSDDGYDIRLVLGNAVLVKAGRKARVKVISDRNGIFTNQLTVPLPDQQVVLKRGYAGFVGNVGGRRFLFLDPHAEAYSGDIAGAQLQEMLDTVASNRKLPTILAGDFNSDPAQAGADAKAYNAAIGAGFVNTGKRVSTCCQDERLDNAQSKLTRGSTTCSCGRRCACCAGRSSATRWATRSTASGPPITRGWSSSCACAERRRQPSHRSRVRAAGQAGGGWRSCFTKQRRRYSPTALPGRPAAAGELSPRRRYSPTATLQRARRR